MRKDDPCIQVCQFDRRTGWCEGCGLSIPEIRGWKKLTPFRRGELMRDLPRRVKQLQASPATGKSKIVKDPHELLTHD